ncbi:host cell division inhibitor Icd-like protein [Salmonella enterica subsp. diarizonae]|nr:host cell division inhibitor Icd-like protein [Salmonella enterica subsp. diarizonae]EGV3636089.1 host cell division inhibitor Icd-like protein [Salmonella enterica]HCM1889325.1 host cell division inhibitor Icd-like protein [Salmonella enterica subsp. diarizonae serovar 57:c:z]
MHKFTWLFLATYADPKALPVVLRTQADTEADARQKLVGDHTLTFDAKINTACPVNHSFYCEREESCWSVIGTRLTSADIKSWGDSIFGGAAHA